MVVNFFLPKLKHQCNYGAFNSNQYSLELAEDFYDVMSREGIYGSDHKTEEKLLKYKLVFMC